MATITISARTKIRRKAGAFTNGDLLEGELGIDTNSNAIYGSTDGTTVVLLANAGAAGALVDLSDVTLTSVADNEVLMYSSGSWINRTFTELGMSVTDLSDVTSAGSGIIISTGERNAINALENGANVKHNLAATTVPGTGDDSGDGYSVGSTWTNTTTDEAWICVDASAAAAVWMPITTGADTEITNSSAMAGATVKDALDSADSRLDSLETDTHTHANKATLDNIAASGSGTIISTAERNKLSGIEASATADQTAGEIKTAYESNADTNAFTDADVTTLAGAIQSTEKGAADGVATLNGSGKIPTTQIPDAVLGQLEYQTTWNASTDTPDLSAGSPTKGDYYKVSVAGSTNLDGITDWNVGDWVVYDGTAWDKIDNTDSVSTVFSRSGAIIAAASDYDASQVDNDSSVAGAFVDDALNQLDSDITAEAALARNAANLTSGAIAAARMSTNVADALSTQGGVDTIIFDAGSI